MQIKSKIYLIGIITLMLPSLLQGQEQTDSIKQLVNSTSINLFVDNTEFATSPYTIDQTMAGVSLTQTIGWQFDKNHAIQGGVDLQKGFGTEKTIDKTSFLAYYQFKDQETLFKAGSFLWDELLTDYNSFFFQDSVRFYKRTMDGLFLKRMKKNGYLKVWLDWSGMQSPTKREQFMIGFSGFRSMTDHVYIDLQSYVEHLANLRPKNPHYYVNDNILAQTTIGYQHRGEDYHYLVAGGLLFGFERNRGDMDNYYTPIGFVGRFDGNYKKFGTSNLIYIGQPRMQFYRQLGNELYYGNPFLQGKYYCQSKIFWTPIRTNKVKSELALKMHFSEKKLYFEQLFTLSVSL